MKRPVISFLILIIITAVTLFLTGSCSKINDQGDTGRLVVKITDAPFPIDEIDAATVTITKVEIRKVSEGESDENPFIVVSEEPMEFNLLELRNGLTEKLLDIEIPVGKYDLIRLYIDNAGLKLKEGQEFNVKVPSGKQTGIKIFINPDLAVEGGLTSELLLDFDLAGSFVLRGNLTKPSSINGFIFKPVIRVSNLTTAGRIEGLVSDTAKVIIKNATIWIKQDTIVATAIADTLGKYAIIGVPAGYYTVSASKEGYDTVSHESVKVIAGNKTIQNFVLIKK